MSMMGSETTEVSSMSPDRAATTAQMLMDAATQLTTSPPIGEMNNTTNQEDFTGITTKEELNNTVLGDMGITSTVSLSDSSQTVSLDIGNNDINDSTTASYTGDGTPVVGVDNANSTLSFLSLDNSTLQNTTDSERTTTESLFNETTAVLSDGTESTTLFLNHTTYDSNTTTVSNTFSTSINNATESATTEAAVDLVTTQVPTTNVVTTMSSVQDTTEMEVTTSLDYISTKSVQSTSMPDITSETFTPASNYTTIGDTITGAPQSSSNTVIVAVAVCVSIVLVVAIIVLIICLKKRIAESNRRKKYKDEENIKDYQYDLKGRSALSDKHKNGFHSGTNDHDNMALDNEAVSKPEVNRNYFQDGLQKAKEDELYDDDSNEPDVFNPHFIKRRGNNNKDFPMKSLQSNSNARMSMGPILLQDSDPSTQNTYDKVYTSHNTFKGKDKRQSNA